MSLKSYCEENNRQHILQEWDTEKNLPLTPDTIAHTGRTPVWWKCEKGHSWCTQVGSRSKSSTGCPKCREEKLEAKRRWHIEEARRRYYEQSEQKTITGEVPLPCHEISRDNSLLQEENDCLAEGHEEEETL